MRLRLAEAANRLGAGQEGFAEADAAGGTGHAGCQRRIIQPGADSYHWVMQTQQMIANHTWRLRRVAYDNAPAGREVHWSSPPHWWLAAVGWLESRFTGKPWPQAIEHAALYANPCLFAVLLLTTAALAAIRFGALPAALLAAAMVMVSPFQREFSAGFMDHHGLLAVCVLLTVLCLAGGGAGWVRSASEAADGDNIVPALSAARRWFIGSAVAGGLGLWVGASSEIPALIGIAVGAVLAARLGRSSVDPTSGARIEPRLWRWWGVAGGTASLLFYLVEYAPDHFGWRLEVNHPLYALAWMAAGELLCRINGAQCGGRFAACRRDRMLIAVCGIALLLPAALAVGFPARFFVVAEPLVWRSHVDYIDEFAPLMASLNDLAFRPWAREAIVNINPLFLAPFAAIPLLRNRRFSVAARAMLLVTVPPASLLGLLALGQRRWLVLSLGATLATLTVGGFVVLLERHAVRWKQTGWGALALWLTVSLLAYPATVAPYLRQAWQDRFQLTGEDMRRAVMRDFAHWLRQRAGKSRVIALSGPTATTELIYFGGVEGIGTYYWENHDGLAAAIAILGAPTEAEARRRLIERHVTYWVIFPWGPFAVESSRLIHSQRPNSGPVPRTFLLDLLENRIPMPSWLRPILYHPPAAPDKSILVLEVAAEQR